jgi:hypothetical protein
MDSLPSKTAMLADVLTKRRRLQQELFQADNGKHTVLVNYTPYMDELAGRIGCHPRLSRVSHKFIEG